ncbi:hypothetical protein BJ944DRAFT_250779 [Cunninghamella echinulata]|nr:hypothetical protein BJ944DRAFT_250779 [Cunninghamella echinulata]
MLRVYSILQLEPLWLKPKPQCELIVQEEEAVAPIQVIQETEVLVEEPTSYQQEVVEPEYQVVEQEVVHVVHRTNTSTEESSVQVIELEIDESDNNKHEKGNNSNISSSSESSSEEEVLEEKEKVVQINGKEELAPITTKDLTSITEEPNDSSNISSSSSSPETPSSAQSPRPRMRLRKDSKFNERRKSMTNKLKRAFSSASSSSSKRNSIIST